MSYVKKAALALATAGAFAAVTPQLGNAQERPVSLGLFGALSANAHNPDFSLLNGALFSDGRYNTGETSLAGAGGLLMEIPFAEWGGASVRLGMHSLGGRVTGVGLNEIEESANYSLDASLLYIEIAPLLRLYDIGVKNLYAVVGPELGMPMSFNATGTETPEGGESREYINTNSIDGTFRLALALGIGYEIPISSSLILAPEASIRFPLTKISSAEAFDSWRATQLRVGVNLYYGFSKKEEDDEIIEEKASSLSVRMGEVGYYDENGKYAPLKEITVEEIRYSELYPLVPYIFFEKDEASLNKKHQSTIVSTEAGTFSIDNIKKEALDVNMNLLNVIGQRLKDNPSASLTITGTHDGKERNGAELSRQRAQAVADYLKNKYGVGDSRLTVQGGSQPSKPSSGNVADGAAENRRAELASADKAIMRPVTLQLNTQRVATPNIVEFRPDIQATDSITEWNLVLTQSGRSLRDFSGTGAPAPIRWVVGVDELASSQVPVSYSLVVSDSRGNQKEVSGTLPVEYISIDRKSARNLPDKRVEKFSLVLFDFDKSEVTGENADIIREKVIPAITPTSTVKIMGYADRIGNAAYNRRLAGQRADAVKNVITAKAKPAAIEARGIGSDLLLFDNDSPIGRQLSRTVQIIIETPVK